jgi:hypothetical protein
MKSKFYEIMKPIDDKIDHWAKEIELMEKDLVGFTDAICEIPEGLEGPALEKAFPGYTEYKDTFSE